MVVKLPHVLAQKSQDQNARGQAHALARGSEETLIGLREMAKEDWSKFKTKGAKKAKGITPTIRSRRRRDSSSAASGSGWTAPRRTRLSGP